jgi:hypothetical protein
MWRIVLVLALPAAISASADDHGYLAKMIACDEKDEAKVENAFDAYLTLTASKELKAGTLELPASLSEKRDNLIFFERGFYLTPNTFRGFAIFVPADCMIEKNGSWISTVALTVDQEDFRQGVASFKLKPKTGAVSQP